jgi:hypothetical protein
MDTSTAKFLWDGEGKKALENEKLIFSVIAVSWPVVTTDKGKRKN